MSPWCPKQGSTVALDVGVPSPWGRYNFIIQIVHSYMKSNRLHCSTSFDNSTSFLLTNLVLFIIKMQDDSVGPKVQVQPQKIRLDLRSGTLL